MVRLSAAAALPVSGALQHYGFVLALLHNHYTCPHMHLPATCMVSSEYDHAKGDMEP